VEKEKLKDKENGHVYTIEEDRANAIRLALSVASEEDVVLVAGKGHEDYMIVKENRFHFSDKEEILKYYENRI
jgi:UDP-N-acetylmuramoyl-L-alanyl-D-glutamate--2,6-diaminopimelate ligase